MVDLNIGPCKHHQEHDEICGYLPSPSEDGEGSPCTYEYHVYPVQSMIDALPEEVTEDNADEVRAQFNEILAFFGALTEEEQLGLTAATRCKRRWTGPIRPCRWQQ
ncbi:MAG: hypothetical protein HFK04_07220 [Oscillospiraceae bacterium]|nr:hypothetical protein [Oscillospiraceae bacterium]